MKKYLLCRRIHLWWQLGSKRPQEVLQLSQGLAKISHLWVVRSVNMRNRSWPAFEIARINWGVKKSAMYIWTSWCYCSVKKTKWIKTLHYTYHLDVQFCIKFGVVGPLFTYKIVDNTIEFLARNFYSPILGSNSMVLSTSKFNENLAVQAVV